MTNENMALLVMDVQPNIVGRLPNKDEYVAKASALVDEARKKKIPVIFVVVGFRAGSPEISPRNKSFGSIPKEMMAAMTDPHPLIAPNADEVVVVKRRISAFSGSDLEVVLSAKDIRHLVLAGISTSGVVLSTVRQAADKDFKITVLSDLCADTDPEVHAVLMGKVFPRQADVMTAEEWMKTVW